MVTITDKPVVDRRAVATGRLKLDSETLNAIQAGRISKGDVLEASTVAAIQAIKETPRLIPHCHPIPIEGADVDWEFEYSRRKGVGNPAESQSAPPSALRCTVTVLTRWKTGVEMEALVGVTTALLCAWDMVKSREKDADGQYPKASIEDVRVVEKFKSKA